MDSYKKLFSVVFPSYLLVVFLSLVPLAVIRWYLVLELNLFEIKEEYWEVWLPFIIPALLMMIVLRPKLKVAVFKKNTVSHLLKVFLWLSLAVSGLSIQEHITKNTGQLNVIGSINEVSGDSKSRYYQLENFTLDRNFATTSVEATNRKHEITMRYYFALPFSTGISTGTKNTSHNHTHWYGLTFYGSMSHRLSDEEKEQRFIEFQKDSYRKAQQYDFHNVRYFEKLPESNQKKQFLNALKRIQKVTDAKKVFILSPHKEDFAQQRDGNIKFIVSSLIVGSLLLIFSLAFATFDEAEFQRVQSGKPDKNDTLRMYLSLLVPKQDHVVTSLILNVNIVVFILMVSSGLDILSPSPNELLTWGANRRFETTNGEWWRLFTSMFVHSGFLHLAMNMFGLTLAAQFIEPIFGKTKFLALYLASGICGSIASIMWYENITSVGASGAILGVFSSVLGLSISNALPKETRITLASLFGLSVLISLLAGLTGGIDNAAHIGGAISGLILGFILHPLIKMKTTPY